MRGASLESTQEPATAGSAVPAIGLADLCWFAGISLLGAALRLFAIEQWSFDAAEAVTYRAVTQPFVGGADGFVDSVQRYYPLGFSGLRYLLDVGVLPGFGEGWMRLPFAFFGCLLVPLLSLLARPMFGRGVAFLAAGLVAVHPGHINASQSADPVVCAVTLMVAAAIARRGGWRAVGWFLLVCAGGCHPLGWLGGLGLFYVVSTGRLLARTPQLVWWILGLHAVVLVPAGIEGFGLLVVLLALVALGLRSFAADGAPVRRLALAALFPLAAGGAWWWFDRSASEDAVLVALPAVAVMACWSAVQFYQSIQSGTEQGALQRPSVTRLLAAAPAIMLLGELLTASFFYFMIYGGGRPPWRDVRDEVLAALKPGQKIEVVAARGCDVMRVYLRPGHWYGPPDPPQPDADPHPGIRVSLLSEDLDAARDRLQEPGVWLVLQRQEWQALLAAEGGAELVQGFVVEKVWSCPQPTGDDPLYLLRRGPT